jgi:hypothetical protein
MTARRVSLAALLALLCWQAGVGLVSEVSRLRETSWRERRAALSLDASWRYRNSLGAGAEWLAETRPHLAPGEALLVVHDGSMASARLAAAFSVLLFPLKTNVIPWPPDEPAPWPPLPAGVDVAHIGPRGGFTQSLIEAGLVPLAQRDDFQLLGRPTRDVTDRDAAIRERAPPPPPDPQRLHGWRLASLLALPLMTGLLALRILGLRRRSDPVAFWGWAWMTGCLLVGLGLLAWMLLGLRLSWLTPHALGGVTALITVAALLPSSTRVASAASASKPGCAGWERTVFVVCLAIALALVSDRILLASSRIVAGGDEAGIWSAKAKALWAADGLGAPFGQMAAAVAHPDYPLLNPLLQVFSFALAGRPLDFENRLLIQLCVPALLLAAAGALRRCVRPSVAGLLLLLLGTARQAGVSTADACADGMVALGFLVALDAGERWRTSGERRWFALGTLALSFLVGSKNEGLMLALAVLVALIVTGVARDARAADGRTGDGAVRRLASWAPWVALPLALAAGGALINARHGFENDLLASTQGVSMPARIVQHAPTALLPLLAWIGSFLLQGGVETHRLFAVGLALVLLFPGLLLRRDASGRAPPYRAVPIALLIALTGFLAVYVSGTAELEGMDGWLRTSFPRVSYQLFPALVVWLGAACARLEAPRSDPESAVSCAP